MDPVRHRPAPVSAIGAGFRFLFTRCSITGKLDGKSPLRIPYQRLCLAGNAFPHGSGQARVGTQGDLFLQNP